MSNTAINAALCLSNQAETILERNGLGKDDLKDVAKLYKQAAKLINSAHNLWEEGCNSVVDHQS